MNKISEVDLNTLLAIARVHEAETSKRVQAFVTELKRGCNSQVEVKQKIDNMVRFYRWYSSPIMHGFLLEVEKAVEKGGESTLLHHQHCGLETAAIFADEHVPYGAIKIEKLEQGDKVTSKEDVLGVALRKLEDAIKREPLLPERVAALVEAIRVLSEGNVW